MNKSLIVLPFISLALIAAKPAPQPVAAPVSVMAVPPEVAADPANRWTLELSNGGKVVIQLRPDLAPQHVYRIQQLTTAGFYDGLVFHRVIPGFMAQGGDPLGTGEGGSKLPDLPAEFNNLPHVRGVTSMARAEALNSANSQFFIMLAPRFVLDNKYSGFGRVIEGMAVVDSISVGEPPAQPTRIVRASIGGPLPAPPVVATAATTTEAPAAATQAAPATPATGTAPAVGPANDPPAATPAPDTAPVVNPANEPPASTEAAPASEAPETPPQEAPEASPQEAPTPE